MWADLEFLTALSRLSLYLVMMTGGALALACFGVTIIHFFGRPNV